MSGTAESPRLAVVTGASAGVTVTCLCPGPTRTRFQERAEMEDSGLFDLSVVMDSATVAERGVDAALAGETIRTPGLANRFNAFSSRLLPLTWLARVVKKVQAPR